MSRRIVHIIDSLSRTGTARQLLSLSQGLARDGWDVHVAALQTSGSQFGNVLGPEFAAADIPVMCLGRRFVVDPLADMRLVRHVTRLRPDVVHTWNTVPGLLGPIVRRVMGGWGRASGEPPVRPHIVAGQCCINRSTPSWEWFIHGLFARHVDRLVAASPTVRDWCIARGLPAERFAVIPYGVPLAPPPGVSRAELLRELKLPADARLIGVVGRLVHAKGVKDLIWAADLLRVLHDNLRLLIIGDGPQRESLYRYARLASDLEHVQFLGERTDVERIMPHLDCLWNASENTGPSLAILEAMAAGVPVVASDTPSNRELIVEGETGHLIPLGTRAGRAARARATDHILSDEALAVRLRAASQKRITERYTIDVTMERCGKMYDEFFD